MPLLRLKSMKKTSKSQTFKTIVGREASSYRLLWQFSLNWLGVHFSVKRMKNPQRID